MYILQKEFWAVVHEMALAVHEAMGMGLFRIGKAMLTTGTLLAALAIALGAYVFSRTLQRLVRSGLARRQVHDHGTVAVGLRLMHYVVVSLGFCLALQTAGVDLGNLFAAGAVFAIGIGFAMQNIAQNFVAGVLLLLERTIRPGDVIDVGGQVVRVRDIGIRSTLGRTAYDEDIIVPNAMLVQSQVKNFTLTDTHYRIIAQLGVSYESDLQQVMQVLGATAAAVPWRLISHEPVVLLLRFDESAVVFEVSVWYDDPWAARGRRSDLNLALWQALRAAQISLACPQLDVHLKGHRGDA